MKSELHETLSILDLLMRLGPLSAQGLCDVFGCSVATLKRRLDDARQLGAHVESIRQGGGWVYHVGNADAIRARLYRWLALERERSLVEARPEIDPGF
jgi:hypothetical protein